MKERKHNLILQFEKVECYLSGGFGIPRIERAAVPGGWILFYLGNNSEEIVFLPDPNHDWELSSD